MSASALNIQRIWDKPEPVEETLSVEEYYAQSISPLMEPYEQLRQEQLKITKQRQLISVVIGTICAVAFALLFSAGYLAGTDGLKLAMYASIAIVGGLYYWCTRPAHYVSSEIKSKVYPKILGYLDGNFNFDIKPPFKVSDLKNSDIIPSYLNEQTEDYVSGTYDGVKVEVFEAKLTKKRNKSTVTVFDGMFVILSSNKRFSSKTVIKKDGGTVGNWFGKAARAFSDLERVRLEDPVFEEKYEVYSDDQVEARFLLTPAFMERLMNLGLLSEFRHATDPIECSFYDDKFLLKIPVPHNRFETPHISEPIDFLSDTEKLLNEMNEIFGIIKVLKMKQRTGL